MDPDRPVEPERLKSLFEAARWSPSCFNEQPWRYLVFDRSDAEARRRAEDCLSEGNAWAKRASVLMIGVYSEKYAYNNKPNVHAPHDLGMASLSMALQATSMGLLFHQMAGFSPTKAREYFNISDGFTPLTMIACGYPGVIEALSEKQRVAETAPRVRRPQEQSFFLNAWPRD